MAAAESLAPSDSVDEEEADDEDEGAGPAVINCLM